MSGKNSTRPEARPRRPVLAQVHTWIAVSLGMYIVMLSLTGSAVVFRRELHHWLTQPAAGSAYPAALRFVEWLVDLHDNLLVRPFGRIANGIGGALVIVLAVTGLIIWWPGRRQVWRSLRIGRPQASRRFAMQLHNVLGVAAFLLILVWALTAVYFAFPDIFERSIDFFDADLEDAQRPGEGALLWLIKLHFGRFAGTGTRVLWVVLGLVPTVLFATGFVLWWMRVMRRRRRTLQP